jgi:predicted ATPase
LTILVGPNNGGKSTVVEALQVFTKAAGQLTLTEGQRNKAAGDEVHLELTDASGTSSRLDSVEAGSSQIKLTGTPYAHQLFVVPARRTFSVHFGLTTGQTRANYSGYPLVMRAPTIDVFPSRLLAVFQDSVKRQRFNAILARIVIPQPVWTIDQSDAGQHYVKLATGTQYHSSEGLGEGILSLLSIVDALYDSDPGNTIVIDEPELSLHPALQRRLARVLSEYAGDRQIIYATHSPYFVSWSDLAAGARIARLAKVGDAVRVSAVPVEVIDSVVSATSGDLHNPHVLGLNASEVFFVDDDRVVLVEGQEDVVVYHLVLDQLHLELPAEFFGWGVGGAEKMERIADLLVALGFRRVAGILDSNQANTAEQLHQRFPDYRFVVIPAVDVRTKEARGARPPRHGLTTSQGILRDQYREATHDLFAGLITWFENGPR